MPVLFDHRPGKGVESLHQVLSQNRILPERRKGTSKVTTLQSFIDLVNRHKDEDSAIFADTAWPPSLTCVVDYAKADKTARWHQHRINYAFPATEEITAWISGNGKGMEQAAFAQFLEDHAAELADATEEERKTFEPLFKERFAAPNELIGLSRELEVTATHKVKRGERLQSGERTVQFSEEHTNGKGEAVILPGVFMISVPAFLDGAPVRIPARLRYRIQGGSIHWSYGLYRAEHWLRNRVKEDMDQAAKATALPAFEGAPEA